MPRDKQQFSLKGVGDEVSLRQLGKYPSEIVHQVELIGEPIIVTREGRPAAYLVPIDYAAEHLELPRASEGAA